MHAVTNNNSIDNPQGSAPSKLELYEPNRRRKQPYNQVPDCRSSLNLDHQQFRVKEVDQRIENSLIDMTCGSIESAGNSTWDRVQGLEMEALLMRQKHWK